MKRKKKKYVNKKAKNSGFSVVVYMFLQHPIQTLLFVIAVLFVLFFTRKNLIDESFQKTILGSSVLTASSVVGLITVFPAIFSWYQTMKLERRRIKKPKYRGNNPVAIAMTIGREERIKGEKTGRLIDKIGADVKENLLVRANNASSQKDKKRKIIYSRLTKENKNIVDAVNELDKAETIGEYVFKISTVGDWPIIDFSYDYDMPDTDEDKLVGFANEFRDQFSELIETLKDCGVDSVHIFLRGPSELASIVATKLASEMNEAYMYHYNMAEKKYILLGKIKDF